MAAGRERRSVSRRRAALRGDHSRRIEEDRGSHRSGGARDRGSPLASATRIFLYREFFAAASFRPPRLTCGLSFEILATSTFLRGGHVASVCAYLTGGGSGLARCAATPTILTVFTTEEGSRGHVQIAR